MKSYSEMITLQSFDERLDYLKLLDNNATSPRHMSGQFYTSSKWQHIREVVLERDLGFDLGVDGIYISGAMIVHHINPINENDIIYQTKKLTDLNNLITVSLNTHNLIHYNKDEREVWVDRRENDTLLWDSIRR